jgi:hypothetical protein
LVPNISLSNESRISSGPPTRANIGTSTPATIRAGAASAKNLSM